MKKSLILGLFLSVSVFATGCAGEQNAAPNPTPQAQTTPAQVPEPAAQESQQQATSSSVTVPQPDGSEVTIEGTPESVVVMAATTLEILYTLGVDQVIGNADLTARPDLIGLFPDSVNIGLTQSPDMEVIATLAPELVIAPSTFMATMQETFEAQGYTIWFASNQTYTATLQLLENLGQIFDVEDRATELITEIETSRATIVERVQGEVDDITVMIIFGAGDNIMFGTNESHTGYILEAFGIANVTDGMQFDMVTAGYVPFSMEQAIVMNPDIIFRIAHGNIEQTAMMFDEMFDRNPAFHAMNAYINGRVYDLEHSLFFSNPGIRTIESFEYIANLLLD